MRLLPGQVRDHSCAERTMRAITNCDTNELSALCHAPLLEASGRWCTRIGRIEQGAGTVTSELGFDVSTHPDASSKVAMDMQSRLAADAELFAEQENKGTACRMTFLCDPDSIVADTQEGKAARLDAETSLRDLIAHLVATREKDATFVRRTLPDLLTRANTVRLDGTEDAIEMSRRELFALRQLAMQEAVVSADFLLCLLISSDAIGDLRNANPFITEESAREIFDELVAAVLHASRVGQINRAVSEAHGLLKLLCPRDGSFGETEAERNNAASALTLKAQSLAEQMLTRRHYVDAITNTYDPRFLLFEFTHNLVLRKAQVELVREFVASVTSGEPLVKQMLMGGGKTTVVGPLLALMLADGERLVLQTMPPALLEQSKATLRATFSSIVRKRVFTLSFDRSSEMRWPTVDKLQTAARNRGVVLCTAATIKSLQLKLLEKMDVLRDTRRKQHPDMERDVRAITQVLKLFRSGCLIMDEVDLLLHPLKAELNFPIGEKHPLDFSPERWTCAIHALDAVFYVERRSMSVSFHQSGRAHRILEELREVIEDGYARRALQRSPHLVLLHTEWYHEVMRPVMVKWMLLWLEANHVAGLTPRQVELFISGGADVKAGQLASGAEAGVESDADREMLELMEHMEGHLDVKTFKLLNLAKEWLRTYLPFCLQKIDRVSFGLLSATEYQRLLKTEPHMPRSRFKLAIPFVGKDVPSRASEFAHPDIIIGLTVLAYRYEGLRTPDFRAGRHCITSFGL